MASALELSCLKVLDNQLQRVKSYEDVDLKALQGVQYIEDDEILGNSDKMLFYSKELQASAEDEGAAHNPFVVGKLDINSIINFNFDLCQGYIETQVTGGG
jgi:hypothetical protein